MTLLGRILFFTIIFSVILGLQFLVYKTFRKYLLRKNLNITPVNWISRTPFLLFIIPYVFYLISRMDLSILPKWVFPVYITPFFIFQGATFFIGVYLLAGKIIKLPFVISRFIIRKIKILNEKYETYKSRNSVQKFDASRRRFITTSAALVSAYAFAGAGIGAIKKDEFEVISKNIKIENLPASLKGTRLVLVSDIHSGPYMPVETMKEYVELINDMNPDVVLIPGDMTNSQRNEASAFTKAFRDIKSKHGIFGTLGNHDYFDNPEYVAETVVNETPIRLLRNDADIIDINGEKLSILGVEDTRDSGERNNDVIAGYADKSLEALDAKFGSRNIPKILLCHKPYVFDNISGKGFDLVLSGHTHGGQIVLAKIGDINLSFAATVSEYISGLYRKNGSQLYVTKGIGSVGLPIRLNCPPEITKITLI